MFSIKHMLFLALLVAFWAALFVMPSNMMPFHVFRLIVVLSFVWTLAIGCFQIGRTRQMLVTYSLIGLTSFFTHDLIGLKELDNSIASTILERWPDTAIMQKASKQELLKKFAICIPFLLAVAGAAFAYLVQPDDGKSVADRDSWNSSPEEDPIR